MSNDVFTGSLASYTEENFVELKAKLQPIFDADPTQEQTDACVKRFLKAFLTVDDALTAFVKNLKWRNEYGVDMLNSNDDDIRKEMETGKVQMTNFSDKAGRPVIIAYARHHNAAASDLDRLTKFTVFILEKTVSMCDENVIDNICIIFDLKDFSLNNMDYGFVKQLVWLLHRRYPERLGKCLIVNYPLVFSGCWHVIKMWINEVTRMKIIFIKDKNHLEEYIDSEYIPVNLM